MPYYNSKFTVLKLSNQGRHLYTLRLHANSVGILCLGPDHPLLSLPEGWTVSKVEYADSALQALVTMSGKRKKGAGVLFPPSTLLTVTVHRAGGEDNFDSTASAKEIQVPVCLPLRIKLIEINSVMHQYPNRLITSPDSQGYLAVGLLRRDYAQALAAVLPIQSCRSIDCENLPIEKRERQPTDEQRVAVDRAIVIKVEDIAID